MSTLSVTSDTPRKKAVPLTYFLSATFVLFIGILIFCYAVTKRANPVFLDEHGKVVTSSDSNHAGH